LRECSIVNTFNPPSPPWIRGEQEARE
jgi:hypothetical protein